MNTVQVEVRSTTLQGVKAYNGKDYGNQRVALHNGSDFPLPFDVYVPADSPYPKGMYAIDGRSYRVDDKGRLILKGIKLLPLGGSSKA